MPPTRLTEKALDWALESVFRNGDTDIFPIPPEYDCIKKEWHQVRSFLRAFDITNYNVRTPFRTLTPKRRYGFRVSTQLDPLDHLFYTALVYEVARDLESTRVPKRKGIVHSYRWKPTANGRAFDPDYGWGSFVRASIERCKRPFNYVVGTDISDFYQRLYFHRIERIIDVLRARSKKDHGTAICNLIRQWNNGVSYGLPIGQLASRVLAESVIADIDEQLINQDVTYTRFNDDFHLFCRTKGEAHENLSFLAEHLFTMHGLTLQESKTEILKMGEFRKRWRESESDAELTALSENLENLAESIGFDAWYELPELDEFPEKEREELQALNLEGLIDDQLKLEDPDTRRVRWILNRLAQLRVAGPAENIVRNVEKISHLIPEIVKHLIAVSEKLTKRRRSGIAQKLLRQLDSGVGAPLAFHRVWVLQILKGGVYPTDHKDIASIFRKFDDEPTRREAILTLGSSGNDSWFRARKQKSSEYGVWQQRAFLLAADCLPQDELRAFFKARKRSADPLNRLIAGGRMK